MTTRWVSLAAMALSLAILGDAAAGPTRTTKAAQPSAATKTTARRLEDVRIEGDVPVPQVVFVTARDPRRFLEFQHGRYRRTSLELARESMLPTRVVLVGNAPTVHHKESAP